MSIEKLEKVNIVGKLDQLNDFAKDIYLFNDIQLINAREQIEMGLFTLPVDLKNLNELLDLANLKEIKKEDQQPIKDLAEELNKIYNNTLTFNPDSLKDIPINTDSVLKEANTFINLLKEKTNKLSFSKENLKKTDESIKAYSFIKDIEFPMRDLNNLQNFVYEIGMLTQENYERLKVIYPSIPSLVFHLGQTDKQEQILFIISEIDFQKDTERVLQALDFKLIPGYESYYQEEPKEILENLEEKKEALEREIEVLEAVESGNLNKLRDQANLIYNELIMLVSISVIKEKLAFSEMNFFFSAWIPISQKEKFENLVKNLDLIMLYQEIENDPDVPTKLKNNWLFRPFESLVKMYGMPNYLELDPTPFFSLTYIFCFGYMFGDVGQGLVLLLFGLFLEKRGSSLGGVLARVSIASIIFGFLYGSVFGLENILPALWLRPMENTNQLLITAVVFGVIMLIISYIFSLINKAREHEYQEEYFGKNGLSGFLIYISVLVFALMLYNYLPSTLIIRDILIVLIVIFTALVFLAEPLGNLIRKKKLMYEVDGQYFVTSFFEVFEMFLSMLSGTLSFLRVGAFALTHVGMFMAFQTIADMLGGGIAGIVVLIVGNIFILVLEGLIDYIQCLRLEFYELFGRYYQGNGREFLSIQQEIQ